MVSSQFGAILKGLETFFKCSLEPDQNDSCLIKMGMGISIQIELDRYGCLLVGCRLGILPMSRYREIVMKRALQSNGIALPSSGIFGFSQKSNQLILFMRLDPLYLSSDQILTLLPPFMTKAKQWSDSLAKGEVPIIEEILSDKIPSGIFGLIS